MADISKITLPNGTTYNIKDSVAREAIEAFAGGSAVVFMGVSTSALSDGGNENPKVDGETITEKAPGQLYFVQGSSKEYVYGKDNKWHELGSLENLGSLAYKNSVNYDKTTSAQLNAAPTFTGNSVHLATEEITVPTSFSSNFTGTQGDLSVTGTPTGEISTTNFTGTGVRLVTDNIAIPSSATFSGSLLTSTGNSTPSGDVSVTTATTANKTAIVSAASSGTATYTPEGIVGTPTISVKTAGSTTTIKNPTSATVAKTVVATAPGQTAPANSLVYYSVSDENLSLYQLGYTTGASITTSNVTVKTGDAAYESTQPTFSGTGVRLVTGNIPVPNTYNATFIGSPENISVSGTPSGSIGLTTSNTKVTVSAASSGTVTYTPTGTISTPTFTGEEMTSEGTFIPQGSVETSSASNSTQRYEVSVAANGSTAYTPSGTINNPSITLGYTSTAATTN